MPVSGKYVQCHVACHMEWNKQIAFNNSNDIYIVFFFGLNTEQTVPARKDAFATFCHLKMDDCDPETLPTSHCGVLSTTLLNHRLISLAKKWSHATFWLVTGVVLFVLNILLLLLLLPRSKDALNKDVSRLSSCFYQGQSSFWNETYSQWIADYKVIRTPNIYCLLKIFYCQFQ